MSHRTIASTVALAAVILVVLLCTEARRRADSIARPKSNSVTQSP